MQLAMVSLGMAAFPATGMSGEAFGIGTQWTTFHVAQWSPTSGTPTPVYYTATGYVGPTDTSYSNYWTQLHLPNGAVIEEVRANVYDNDGNGHWNFSLLGYEAAAQMPPYIFKDPAAVTLGTAASGHTAKPGYTTLYIIPTDPVVIRSWGDLDNDNLNGSIAINLALNAQQSDGTDTLRFWGAAVKWHRTLSVAPASASFNDVPDNHWAFREIEALANSGITTGCGDSNFCPDQTVTRAQMAVFLAKALGLHWAY